MESLVKKFGTPLYVFSQRTLTNHFQKLDTALAPLDHLICYSVKANSNLAVLRALANLGSGFDIVSGGELERVIAAGGDPAKCVFAGVGKTEQEIEFGIRKRIYSFNAESEPELVAYHFAQAGIAKSASNYYERAGDRAFNLLLLLQEPHERRRGRFETRDRGVHLRRLQLGLPCVAFIRKTCIGFNLLLKFQNRVQDSFRNGRAARNVDIHGNDFVDALHHVIGAIESSAGRAGAHRNDPLGFGHLIVDLLQDRGHLVIDSPQHHQNVRLLG